MPITLTINGDNAEQILQEISILASGLVKTKVEWKQVSMSDLDVRMATSVNDGFGTRVVADVPMRETATLNGGLTTAPLQEIIEVEDKPKRKRRTKEEMEAERAAGLPPQEGDPDLDPIATTSDLLDDDAPVQKTYTRADVQERVSKIVSQRTLTPAEIRTVFMEHGGQATNAVSMDEKFAEAVALALDAAVAAKGG